MASVILAIIENTISISNLSFPPLGAAPAPIETQTFDFGPVARPAPARAAPAPRPRPPQFAQPAPIEDNYEPAPAPRYNIKKLNDLCLTQCDVLIIYFFISDQHQEFPMPNLLHYPNELFLLSQSQLQDQHHSLLHLGLPQDQHHLMHQDQILQYQQLDVGEFWTN